MKTYINGEAQEIKEGSTVASLVETLGLDMRKVAIEVNLNIIPRALYADTWISAGDRIEVVQFIGGG